MQSINHRLDLEGQEWDICADEFEKVFKILDKASEGELGTSDAISQSLRAVANLRVYLAGTGSEKGRAALEIIDQYWPQQTKS